MSTTTALPALLKILADDTRLRVLGLLAQEELGVGELARVLGMSSSRLGNHLRILRESGVVASRREGSWTFVRLDQEGALPSDLWQAVEELLQQAPDFARDVVRLGEVLEERRERSRSYFDQVAREWDAIGADFATGIARERVATHLLNPQLVVADVGCGTGYLSGSLRGLVGRVILVDHAPAMLEEARRNLEERAGSESSGTRFEFRTGEIDALPLADEEVDAVIAGMVLHHAPDLGAFLRQVWRVLKPGGRLVVEDLLPHREAWMQESMADLRLGLDPDALSRRVREAGFEDLRVEVVQDHYRPERPEGDRVELPVFVLRAQKPAPSGATHR